MRPLRFRYVALGVVLLVALASIGAWALWPRDASEARLESSTETALFPFSSSMRKSLAVELRTSSSQFKGADEVRSAVTWAFEEEANPPGTASGKVACHLQVLIDGNGWHEDRMTFETSAWPKEDQAGRDEPSSKSAKFTDPPYDDSDVTGKLGSGGDHILQATVDCASTVSTTGPTTVTVTLGPLFAIVKS